jgi:hypothetical protein
MAHIDTSGIENFDSMTADEKVTALLAFRYDDGTDKIKAAEENAAKMKAAFDKASSEAASYKKQLNASKSEEELKRQESEETLKAMQEKLAEYEQREKISTAKAAFLGGGFDETTAADAANAFITGDIEKMSAAVKKFREFIEVSTKSKLMGSNPKPESGAKTDDDGTDNNIAVQLGKERAERAKKAQSILDQYTRR